MFRKKIAWLVPIAVSVLGLGAVSAPATAETTYTYNAIFNGISTRSIVGPDTNQIFLEAESNDAPLGLTELTTLIYSHVNPITGAAILNTDPNVFGLQGKPDGSVVFLGTGSDKLFGSISVTGLVDFRAGVESLSNGIVNITGGEGSFSGANGTLSLSGSVMVYPEPNVPEETQIILDGSFTAVPEPSSPITVIILGVSAAGVLLRRRYRCEQREKVGSR